MSANSALATTSVTLANGLAMPIVGFGTYQLRGEECQAAVKHALAVGYRHIDTASVYRNEEDIAAALKASGIRREDVFITSKLQPQDQGAKAYEACLASLARLGTDYVDCTLLCLRVHSL